MQLAAVTLAAAFAWPACAPAQEPRPAQQPPLQARDPLKTPDSLKGPLEDAEAPGEAAPGLSPFEPRPQTPAPPACLTDSERENALRVGLVSLTPAALCAPSYQVIEIRNDGPAPLAEARILATPPLGEGKMRFEPLPGVSGPMRRYVEISTDDGASWTPVDPPLGSGAVDDPLVFSSQQIPALRRLGASGEKDDSVLVRWRASLGETFGEPFAGEALLGLSGQAIDACRRPLRAPQRLARLSLTRPALSADLEGRNLTRGGGFARDVRAAPGDEIEWRAALENVGEAAAPVARAELVDLAGDPDSRRVLALDGATPGARRTTLVRMAAGASCAPRRFRLSPSWGCAAPPAGAPAALTPLSEGSAYARVSLAPDPNAIAITLSMTGEDGSARPGDRAEVSLEARNIGPPAFQAELLATLPDGYAPDRDAPILLFSTSPGVAQAVWADPDVESDGTARIRLLDKDGAPATLDPDAFAQVSFPADRLRRSVLESDRLSARMSFVSACGEPGRSRPARIPITPRQSALSARIDPLGPALIRERGDRRRFRATIANGGEEAAERLTARLTLGAGWAAETPAPEICLPEDTPVERRFICSVEGAARPGAAVSFDFEVEAGAQAGPPRRGFLVDEGTAPDFSIKLAVASYRSASGVEAPLTEAVAESGAVGYRIRQRLLDPSGFDRGERPVDLGEEVVVAVDAEWWGAGRAEIADPSLTLTLPRALSVRSIEGALGDRDAPAVARRDLGQILWSLPSFAGAGRFQGRITAVAVDPLAVPAARAGGADARERGATEAETVFSVFGRSYGVDALAGATSADPLRRLFRKPDLRLSFEVAGREAAETISVAAGETATSHLVLSNRGGGPGYLDWAALTLPAGVSIADFGDDGLDNDGDGRVDEPDEREAAERQKIVGAERLRWMRLPGAGSRISETSGLLEPGDAARWPVLLRVAPDVSPGGSIEIGMSAKFGARPQARSDGAGRAVTRDTAILTAARLAGALALTETRAPGVAPDDPAAPTSLERTLRHGALAEHRASVRLPPGRHRDARMAVSLPPAFALAEATALRIGAGVSCQAEPNGADRGSEARGSEARGLGARGLGGGGLALPGRGTPPGDEAEERAALIWRLGDCTVDPAAPPEARVALMDFRATVQDASPEEPAEAREAWRRPKLVAWMERRGGALDSVERYPLGESALTIRGPLLSARLLDPVEGGMDAGDRFTARVEAVNLGDEPAEAVALSLAPTSAPSVDCAALRISAAVAAFDQVQSECGVRAALTAPLPPGESATFEIEGRIRSAAAIGVIGRYEARLAGRAGGSQALVRAGALSLGFGGRAADAPRIDVAARPRDGAPDAERADLGIGQPLSLRVIYPIAEGEGEAIAALRLRLLDADGEPVAAAAPAFDLIEAGLSKDRDALTLGADPGGLTGKPPRTRAPITGAVRSTTQSGGWRRFSLPLGALSRRGAAVDGPADATLAFETVLAIQDDPSLRDGLQLEAEALLEIGAAAPASTRRILARLAEPTLTVAVRTDAPDGAARIGRRTMIVGEVCNRGAAPAFDVALDAMLPAGFVLEPDAAPRFGLRPGGAAPGQATRGQATTGRATTGRATTGRGAAGSSPPTLRAPRGVGRVETRRPADPSRGITVTARAAPGVALKPGDCAQVSVEGRLTRAPANRATTRFAVSSYSSRPRKSAGRQYRGGPSASSDLSLLTIDIDAPSETEAAPGERTVARFVVSAPRSQEPLRLRLSVDAAGGAGAPDWVLWRDGDGDGAFDVDDPLWRDGVRLEPGEALAVFAVARAPRQMGPRWRRPAVLRASGLSASGRVAAGLAPFSVRRRDDRLGALTAERRMAVDRDCDGDLMDETAQDATFEPAKEAAPGECLAMRLTYRNAGATAVESVSIEDAPPAGLDYLPGGARATAIPEGLILGGVREPGAAGGAVVRFDFVGALAPGRAGVVEYRLRLPINERGAP